MPHFRFLLNSVRNVHAGRTLTALSLITSSHTLCFATERCASPVSTIQENAAGIPMDVLTISGEAAKTLFHRLKVPENEALPRGSNSHVTVKAANGIECQHQILMGSAVPGPDGHLYWPSDERFQCKLEVNDKGIAVVPGDDHSVSIHEFQNGAQ